MQNRPEFDGGGDRHAAQIRSWFWLLSVSSRSDILVELWDSGMGYDCLLVLLRLETWTLGEKRGRETEQNDPRGSEVLERHDERHMRIPAAR